MQRAFRMLGSMAGLATTGILLAALALVLSACGRPHVAQPSSPTVVQVEPTLEAYPVPGLTTPPLVPLDTPTPADYPGPPTRTLVPISTQPVSPTPASFTPFPTLTLAPTWTPVPGAEGAIVYQRRDPEGPAVYQLPIDAVGRAAAPAARILDTSGLWGTLYPSPDNKFVVIAHGVEAGEVIYVLDVTRGQITPLIKDLKTAAFGSPGQFLSWHPSSNEVLYKTTNGSEPGLWRVDIHTGERYIVVQPIPPDGISGGAVSPDGQTIVYAWYRSIEHPGQIWMVDVDGSNPRLIAEGGTYYVFSWSPNSDYLVYTGEPSENEGTPSSGSPLWIMDASGQNRRRLQGPFIFGWGFIPVWSPDGHKLAYVGTSADEPFGEKPIPSNVGELDEWLLRGTSIYVEDIVNGEVQRLSQGIDPTWSPDGTRIVFVSNQSGSPEIWMTNADGTELRQLTEEGKPIRYPTWLQR